MENSIFYRHERNLTASALFGAGVLLLIQGGLILYFGSAGLNWIERLSCLSGIIYVALGLAAQRFRLLAALLGVAFYTAFLAFECFLDVNVGVNLLMANI